jgi:hypothetical protein
MKYFSCILESRYDEKWKGLCWKGQEASDPLSYGVDHEECKDRCTTDQSCIAFASHPLKYCYITIGGLQGRIISQWTANNHLKYTCYAKSLSISSKHFLFTKILLFFVFSVCFCSFLIFILQLQIVSSMNRGNGVVGQRNNNLAEVALEQKQSRT